MRVEELHTCAECASDFVVHGETDKYRRTTPETVCRPCKEEAKAEVFEKRANAARERVGKARAARDKNVKRVVELARGDRQVAEIMRLHRRSNWQTSHPRDLRQPPEHGGSARPEDGGSVE